MSALRVREIWRMAENVPTALLATVLLKVFRLKNLGVPSVVVYPMPLVPIDDDAVPQPYAGALRAASDELFALGFVSVGSFRHEPEAGRALVARDFLSPDGRTFAERVVAIEDPRRANEKPPPLVVTAMFSSGIDDATRLITVDNDRDLESALSSRIVRVKGGVDDAWRTHRARLAAAKDAPPVLDAVSVRALVQRDNDRWLEHAIARGLYRFTTEPVEGPPPKR